MKSISYSLGERLVLQVTSLSSVVLYASTMTAADFGLLYFLVALGNVFGVLILLGNEQTIMNEFSCENDGGKVLVRRLYSYSILAILLLIIFGLLNIDVKYYVLVAILLTYVFQVFEIQAKYLLEFRKLFYVRIFCLILLLPFKVYLWYLGIDEYYIYASVLVLDVILPFLILSKSREIASHEFFCMNSFLGYLGYLKRSSSKVGASLIVIGFSRADVVLSKFIFGNEVSAIFSILQRFLAPIGLVVSALGGYFYPSVLKARSENDTKSEMKLTRQMFYNSSVVVIVLALMIYVVSEFLLRYVEMGSLVDLEILSIYLLAAVFGSVAALVSFRYNLEEKYFARLIRAVVTLAVMVFGAYALAADYGYFGIAYSYLFAQFGAATIFNWSGRHGIDVWLRSVGWRKS